MTEFGERLRTLTIRAQSHDGRVRAIIRGVHSRPRIAFTSPDDYASFQSADEAAAGIAEVIESVVDAVAAERGRLISAHTPFTVSGSEHWNARYRRVESARQELEAVAFSPDGAVGMRSWGLRDWEVRLAPNALHVLSAAECAAAVNAAIIEVHRDHAAQLCALRSGEEIDVR
ncbi:hypothetical protein [Stackebrandtia soli]|uniref:hypothetical protein n=1 Tax=Stackebrandtia soli TaxID=1892856 RepID=UPI0039EC1741